MARYHSALRTTRFLCPGCSHLFEAEPGRIEDCTDTPWHPWEYFATCPVCETEAPQQAQARHLLKAWAKATGPKTAEGKAKVRENLAGHPTPEETIRTRFNAMKHGLNAEVATYFPAKPGKYPHCDGCPYWLNCHPGDACQRRTELFLRHRIAFETKDPGLLTDLRADLHAMVMAVLQDMMRAVMADGVRILTPAWYYDRNGRFHLAKYKRNATGDTVEFDEDDEDDNPELAEMPTQQIVEIREHPLLKRIGDWVRAMGLDLNSQGMTPKVQEDEDVIRGHLSSSAQNEVLALDYQRRNAEALEGLRGMFERARERVNSDPVLVQHQRAEDTDA